MADSLPPSAKKIKEFELAVDPHINKIREAVLPEMKALFSASVALDDLKKTLPLFENTPDQELMTSAQKADLNKAINKVGAAHSALEKAVTAKNNDQQWLKTADPLTPDLLATAAERLFGETYTASRLKSGLPIRELDKQFIDDAKRYLVPDLRTGLSQQTNVAAKTPAAPRAGISV